MATAQQLITAVTSHLGNRNNGQIGSQTVSEAIFDSLNNGIMKITKRYRLPLFERTLSINVTNATYLYALPIQDSTGASIRVKNLTKVVSLRVGDITGRALSKMSAKRRDSIFPVTSSSSATGEPAYYSIFENKLELYPFPDSNYTLYLRASIWASKMLTVNDVQPLGEEWDDVLEEFATSDCFAKLQQSLDSNLWNVKYKESLKQTAYALSEEPDWDVSVGEPSRSSTNPQLDPFVGSFN